jgi:hypothetical protein
MTFANKFASGTVPDRGGTGLRKLRSFRQDNRRQDNRSIREMIMADDNGTDRTTIIETGGGGGGGGVLAVVLLVIVVLVLLFLFRDQLGFGSRTTEVKVPDEINVNVN